MRMRKGAPLLFALAALLGAAQAASASHCGFFRFSSCRDDCSDAQSCYSSCQQQNRAEEADADQEIRRYQQVADRLGKRKKQGKPLPMSDTASYDVLAAT